MLIEDCTPAFVREGLARFRQEYILQVEAGTAMTVEQQEDKA